MQRIIQLVEEVFIRSACEVVVKEQLIAHKWVSFFVRNLMNFYVCKTLYLVGIVLILSFFGLHKEKCYF